MREYKLIAFSAASTFLFCSGALTNNWQMYWMATTLILLMVGAYWMTRLGLHGIQVQRFVDEEAWEGKALDVRIRVQMKGWNWWFKPWLLVYDKVPETLVNESQDFTRVNFKEDDEGEVRYTIMPRRRGIYTVGPLQVISTDPIGLYWMMMTVDQTAEVLVYPRPVPIPNWQWAGGGDLKLQVSDSPFRKGEGLEWQGIREYVPGDPLRRVHWRATARTNRWHVKEFEIGYLSEMVIVLDLYPSPLQDSSGEPLIEQAIRHATWLGLASMERNLPVRVVGSNWKGVAIKDKEPESRLKLLKALAAVQANGHEPLPNFVSSVLTGLKQRASVCVISNQPDPHLIRLSHAAHQRGFPVTLIAVTEPDWLPAREVMRR